MGEKRAPLILNCCALFIIDWIPHAALSHSQSSCRHLSTGLVLFPLTFPVILFLSPLAPSCQSGWDGFITSHQNTVTLRPLLASWWSFIYVNYRWACSFKLTNVFHCALTCKTTFRISLITKRSGEEESSKKEDLVLKLEKSMKITHFPAEYTGVSVNDMSLWEIILIYNR